MDMSSKTEVGNERQWHYCECYSNENTLSKEGITMSPIRGKVLDATFIPIEVGDTLYSIHYDSEYVVLGVGDEVRGKITTRSDNCKCFVAYKNLTHSKAYANFSRRVHAWIMRMSTCHNLNPESCRNFICSNCED